METGWWKLGTSHKNITTEIILPNGVDGNMIQAWAHGPSSGRVAILDVKTVRYTLNLLPDDNYFEA